MQAVNGWRGLRSRGRLIGCCVVLVSALLALVLAPVATAAKEVPPIETYLALGDSVAFGYTQQNFDENHPNESPSYFEGGYVNVFAKSLRRKHKGLVTVNDGCPGETTESLIGENEAIGGKNEAAYKPCAYHFEEGLPLHNSLGTLSQLEDAVSILTAEDPYTKTTPAHPVVGITVNVGATDELVAVAACEKEVGEEYAKEGKSKYGEDPEHALSGCLVTHAFGPEGVFAHILSNLKDIANVIDSTGYANPIVLLGFYNPDTFVLPGSDSLQQVVNDDIGKAIAKGEFPPNVKFANPFAKFNPRPENGAKEKAAIAADTEMCNPNVQKPSTGHDPGCEGDIDPTPLGYAKLARIVLKAFSQG